MDTLIIETYLTEANQLGKEPEILIEGYVSNNKGTATNLVHLVELYETRFNNAHEKLEIVTGLDYSEESFDNTVTLSISKKHMRQVVTQRMREIKESIDYLYTENEKVSLLKKLDELVEELHDFSKSN